MKRVFKIIPIIIILVFIPTFYLFMVNEGFSPHNEGMNIRIEKPTPTQDKLFNEFPVYELTEKDFERYPMIKDMMDILLITEFSEIRDGYRAYGPDWTPYWVNVDPKEVSIQNGMSTSSVNNLQDWISEKETFLFKYQDQIFQIGMWIS